MCDKTRTHHVITAWQSKCHFVNLLFHFRINRSQSVMSREHRCYAPAHLFDVAARIERGNAEPAFATRTEP